MEEIIYNKVRNLFISYMSPKLTIGETIIKQQKLLNQYKEMIPYLAKDEEKIRMYLAANAEITENEYKLFVEDVEQVRMYLAYNEQLKNYPNIVQKLAVDSSLNVRISLAECLDIRSYYGVTKALSEDSDKQVRLYLMKNEYFGCFEDIVHCYASRENRFFLALHPCIKKYPDIIESLLNDEDERIRGSLALNRCLVDFPEVVKKLEADESKVVKRNIKTKFYKTGKLEDGFSFK